MMTIKILSICVIAVFVALMCAFIYEIKQTFNADKSKESGNPDDRGICLWSKTVELLS